MLNAPLSPEHICATDGHLWAGKEHDDYCWVCGIEKPEAEIEDDIGAAIADAIADEHYELLDRSPESEEEARMIDEGSPLPRSGGEECEHVWTGGVCAYCDALRPDDKPTATEILMRIGRERSIAPDVLAQAASLVSGERDRQHGDKRQNFDNIAALWRAYLGCMDLTAHDVACMMVLMKIARTKSGEFNLDDYIDAAGYAACAAQVAR